LRKKSVVVWYVVLSLATGGPLLVVSLVLSAQAGPLSFSDKVVVGAFFMASCVFGIVQSTKLYRSSGSSKKERTYDASVGDGQFPRRVGHHPFCGRFEDHITTIMGKNYCSGCLGLAVGSGIALLLMSVYLLLPTVSPGFGVVLVFVGFSLMILDLAETAIHSRTQKIHVLANLLLVVGFLLIAIGVSGATSSGAYGLLAILVSFLWLDARIQLSNWKHASICQSCAQDCKSY
jgi:uncharacterized membrane protein